MFDLAFAAAMPPICRPEDAADICQSAAEDEEGDTSSPIDLALLSSSDADVDSPSSSLPNLSRQGTDPVRERGGRASAGRSSDCKKPSWISSTPRGHWSFENYPGLHDDDLLQYLGRHGLLRLLEPLGRLSRRLFEVLRDDADNHKDVAEAEDYPHDQADLVHDVPVSEVIQNGLVAT